MKKNKSKLKVNFKWPKESASTKKAIDTLVNNGYVFHTSVSIGVNGMRKAFCLEKDGLKH